MLCNASEFFGYVFRVEDEIDTAGGHGATRHRVVLGRIVLRKGNTALGFDRFQAECAVGGGSRKDDADGALALVLGE